MTQHQTTPAGGEQTAHAVRRTVDHDTIRRWAEERSAFPVHAVAPLDRGDPRTLRIRVPGKRMRTRVEPIQWHEWFERFDEQRFAFVFEDRAPDGKPSVTNRLVRRRGEA